MKLLLNLFAAVALLVWGTKMVCNGVLERYGESLRKVMHHRLNGRLASVAAGIGITALVQSSTATSLMASSFVSDGLMTLPVALSVMRGADIGTAMISVLFSMDLSWLSPLAIFLGVVLSVSRKTVPSSHLGKALIGLGLMLLALRLIVNATEPLLDNPVTHVIIQAISRDLSLEIAVGALLAMLSYSSLAVVLLVSAMTNTGALTLAASLGLVLGANLGSGILGVFNTAKAPIEAQQVTVGNLIFKCMGVLCAIPFIQPWMAHTPWTTSNPMHSVVLFHLTLNVVASIAFLGLTQSVAHLIPILLHPPKPATATLRPCHLDQSVLGIPSLVLSNAARETLHQADVVENMLLGLLKVIQTNDLQLAQEIRQLDDTVDRLYSGIKYYLTKIPAESLSPDEYKRWSKIIYFAINLEQIADITEHLLTDVEEKKIKPQRSFSQEGIAEIAQLHGQLVANLRLAMSVFLNHSESDAAKLRVASTHFKELERAYARSHLHRLMNQTPQSRETSSLHIDLISDLRQINSRICSIAHESRDRRSGVGF